MRVREKAEQQARTTEETSNFWHVGLTSCIIALKRVHEDN